jgi:hypothetical protein
MAAAICSWHHHCYCPALAFVKQNYNFSETLMFNVTISIKQNIRTQNVTMLNSVVAMVLLVLNFNQ